MLITGLREPMLAELGTAYAQMGRFDEAVATVTEEARTELGLVLAANPNHAEARKLFDSLNAP